MARTQLSDQYARHLNGKVEWASGSLALCVVTRLAEYLWLLYPEARSVTIALNEPGGRAELVEVRATLGKKLYELGDEGVLFSVRAEDARDKNGAQILDDVALLGALLPVSGNLGVRGVPGSAKPSEDFDHGWDIVLPEAEMTERRQFLAEKRLES